MKYVIIDFESRSRLDLGYTSAYKYAAHESTEILCMAYSVDGGPRKLWLPGVPFPFKYDWTEDVEVWAFGGEYEYAMWEFCCVRKYGWPHLLASQVRCLQARAAYQGLPRKLDKLGGPLGLGRLVKDKEGHKVMLQLCKPKKAKKPGGKTDYIYVGGEFDNDPAKHARNEKYCLRDVRAEGMVARLCPPLPKREQEIWQAHREINARGVPVDMDMCRTAVQLVSQEKARLTAKLQDITGIPKITVDALPTLKDWMINRGILELPWPRTKTGAPALGEDVLTDALKGKFGELPYLVNDVLEIRQLCSNTAVTKYKAFLNYCNEDGYAQNTHKYYEAGPGRFAGAGPQPQNLHRLDENTLADRLELADRLSAGIQFDVPKLLEARGGAIPTLAGMIRLAVKAKPGNVLVVADYSAIEMRKLHWLAGDEKELQVIRDYDSDPDNHPDPYKLAAAAIYNKPVSEVTKAERQTGKVQRLGCGYVTGATTFAAFCEGYGIDMPFDRAKEIVQLYRRSYPLVKRFWYKVQDAAVNAVTKGGVHQVGYLEYYMDGTTLNCRLPSGREIKYANATVGEGAFGPEVQAVHTITGGIRGVGMPILVENADQGSSRDLLCAALITCRKEGVPVVMHVHDEIVAEVPEKHGDYFYRLLSDIMKDSPRWARGLPVATGGGVSVRYTK